MYLQQGCQTRGLLGIHIVCWKPCRGPHEIFNLEITAPPGNDLGNVARSEVDLQKKKVGASQVSPVFKEVKRLFGDERLQHCRNS